MTHGVNHLDRLLPRHGSPGGLDISWNVRQVRAGLRKKEETYSRATIVDLSLEGALIEVPDSQVHDIGSTVAVRFQGHDASVKIRHCRRGADDTLLYGVRFVPNGEIRDALDFAVGAIRGHSEELNIAWNRRK